MSETLKEKQKRVIERFSPCRTKEELYNALIDWGQTAPKLDPADKVVGAKVNGCQSLMYLKSWLEGERIYYAAESDALISMGLALLLTEVYSGESPETVLQFPPDHIEELGIAEALTPGRASGLANIYLKMKQEALRYLLPR